MTSKWGKRLRNVVIGILAVCILGLLLLPLIIITQANDKVIYKGNSSDHPLQQIYDPKDYDLETNEMMLTTEDGLEVWASEVLVQEPKGVIIYLSGIRQPSVTYFYGHSKWMKKEGYASILLEVRGHGQSEGDTVCFGYEEVLDVRAVVDYISNQEEYKDLPIIIHGVSMGGAIAINAFGSIEEIDGLIAMSPYSSFADVFYDTMKGYGAPAFICEIEKGITNLYLTALYWELRDMKPSLQIQNTYNRPAFLIASTGDTEVKSINTVRLSEVASGNCEVWLRDTWEHFIIKDCDFINMEDDTEYCQRVLEFIENVID